MVERISPATGAVDDPRVPSIAYGLRLRELNCKLFDVEAKLVASVLQAASPQGLAINKTYIHASRL